MDFDSGQTRIPRFQLIVMRQVWQRDKQERCPSTSWSHLPNCFVAFKDSCKKNVQFDICQRIFLSLRKNFVGFLAIDDAESLISVEAEEKTAKLGNWDKNKSSRVRSLKADVTFPQSGQDVMSLRLGRHGCSLSSPFLCLYFV